jgi:flavin-dependent dehydrogenase
VTVPSPEVVVLGAGPAGAAAARLLALWGHRVKVIAKPHQPGLSLAESVPPSTRKLFDALGVREAIDRAGFVRSTGNTVWWGSGESRSESFADGRLGWQITADRLEPLLRDAAMEAGVDFEERRADSDDGQGVPFTLDCTGRSGVLARARRLRRLEPDLKTVALVGLWQPDRPFDVPDATHTLIESYADGWAWSVPDHAGLRFVAVMVDPRTSALHRGEDSRAVYLAEIRKTPRFRTLLANAALVAGPSGWDASMYWSERYVDDSALLVGDAGSFIDPLSSAGVKKALASGWLAAVAVHTSLVRPAMQRHALAFFDARETEVYAAFRAQTVRHLSDAAAGHTNPFWNDRADSDAMTDGAAPHPGADVAAAFERIRQSETLNVRRSDRVRIEPRPAVHGIEIVLEDRLLPEDGSAPIRYAYDVDLIALIELAPSHTQVSDLFAAYQRRAAPVALPDFLAALSLAVARGWLIWNGRRPEGATDERGSNGRR